MSTATQEKPVEVTVIEPSKEVKLSVQKDIDIADRLKKKLKKAAKNTKNAFLRAMRWIRDKATAAWEWFTGKVRAGAKWLKKRSKQAWNWTKAKAKKLWAKAKRGGKKAWVFTKSHSKKALNWGWKAVRWAWEHGVAFVLWTTTPVRIGLGTLLGVAWVTAFGVPVLVAAGLGLLAYWLIAGESLTADVKKANKKAKAKKVDKEAADRRSWPATGINPASGGRCCELLTDTEREHETQEREGHHHDGRRPVRRLHLLPDDAARRQHLGPRRPAARVQALWSVKTGASSMSSTSRPACAAPSPSSTQAQDRAPGRRHDRRPVLI